MIDRTAADPEGQRKAEEKSEENKALGENAAPADNHLTEADKREPTSAP